MSQTTPSKQESHSHCPHDSYALVPPHLAVLMEQALSARCRKTRCARQCGYLHRDVTRTLTAFHLAPAAHGDSWREASAEYLAEACKMDVREVRKDLVDAERAGLILLAVKPKGDEAPTPSRSVPSGRFWLRLSEDSLAARPADAWWAQACPCVLSDAAMTPGRLRHYLWLQRTFQSGAFRVKGGRQMRGALSASLNQTSRELVAAVTGVPANEVSGKAVATVFTSLMRAVPVLEERGFAVVETAKPGAKRQGSRLVVFLPHRKDTGKVAENPFGVPAVPVDQQQVPTAARGRGVRTKRKAAKLQRIDDEAVKAAATVSGTPDGVNADLKYSPTALCVGGVLAEGESFAVVPGATSWHPKLVTGAGFTYEALPLGPMGIILSVMVFHGKRCVIEEEDWVAARRMWGDHRITPVETARMAKETSEVKPGIEGYLSSESVRTPAGWLRRIHVPDTQVFRDRTRSAEEVADSRSETQQREEAMP